MVIADTGFFLALANRRDRHHAVAVRCQTSLKRRIITTWPILTETCHLLVSRLGGVSVDRFLGAVSFRNLLLKS